MESWCPYTTMEQPKLSKQQRRDMNRLKKRKLGDNAAVSDAVDSVASKKARTAGTSVYKRAVTLPPSEYVHPKVPRDRFIYPSDKSIYRDLLDRCYDGFLVDGSQAYCEEFHNKFKSALLKMDSDNLFQYDFTQPAGLNTLVKKTLVTRCLVGDCGITYKYLGIRMFSHPWNDEGSPVCKDIKTLNDQMVDRTSVLLKESKRSEYGSCNYNLTLINKCFAAETGCHKKDPMFSKDKLSVSWHADSSLEHFSSIGVYHFVVGGNESRDESWKIALRVQHYSEGPSHGKKTAGDSISCTVPPIAIPLPSRSSYYLLDDFNHHHQHAVIEGNFERYASTHRVSRTDGHSYQYILNKCRSVVQDYISASPKHIRGVHLAYSELEFEWIRQFYVQGSLHFKLHPWWTSRMDLLVDLWLELQSLYMRQMEYLSLAAVAPPDISLMIDRKERKKMRKSIKKISVVTAESYDEIIIGLSDIVEKRNGWHAREAELDTLSDDLRPMKLPKQPQELVEIEGFIRVMERARTAFSFRHK